MKKNIFTLSLIALLIAAALTSCTPADNAVTTKNVRVIGTAKLDRSATRAIAAEEKFVIDSVDKVMVNGKDIKNDLTPVGTVTDGQNNVTFEAEVTVPKKVTFTADAKPGYVFDEWEVLESEEAKGNKDLKKTLKQVEKWLEKNDLEHSETLVDVPAEYIQYLVAEYDNGYYVTLGSKTEAAVAETEQKNDGTSEHPYTVDEFIALEYDDDELTLVISGDNDAEFSKLVEYLTKISKLEELKLKANGASLDDLSALAKFEEIALTGFTFKAPIDIDNAENEYKFVNCEFLGNLTINSAKEIELKGCTANDITINAAEEVEIEGGTAKNITINNAGEVEIEGGTAEVITIIAAEEVELEDLTATTIDLSKMTTGEVEIENVTCNDIRQSASIDKEDK